MVPGVWTEPSARHSLVRASNGRSRYGVLVARESSERPCLQSRGRGRWTMGRSQGAFRGGSTQVGHHQLYRFQLKRGALGLVRTYHAILASPPLGFCHDGSQVSTGSFLCQHETTRKLVS